MAKQLDVYLNGGIAGHLVQGDGGDSSFRYAETWLTKSGAIPLSQSLPLRKERFRQKECSGFFKGILPEESKREIVARNLGISARNDYAMLERIGGECAGAVTFVPHGESLPERNYGYRTLSTHELAGILRELPKRPLLAGEEGVRLSLAGAQDKIAVRIEDGEVCLPMGGAPSTHILKPAVERFEGVVFNEAFCMKLALAAGLPAAGVETRNVEGVDYLLVQRYDRAHVLALSGETVMKRLHQEDFCQALGIVPEHKYQKEGGPSLKQCFSLVRQVSSTPVIDLARLLDAVIFNHLVGNNDGHGKNFSLIYSDGVRFAPLYDVVSTVCYPELTREMAMRIGSTYASDNVTGRDFEQLAEETGLGKPLVHRRVAEVAERVIAALSAVEIGHPTAGKVAGVVRERAHNLLRR